MKKKTDIIWALVRIALGLIFLWAFFDKIFGLGFSTKSEAAWINGVSPTLGFLKFAAKGPFVGVYQSLIGIAAIDWLFMLGLLGIGLALLLGIGMRLASITGTLLMLLLYGALIPPEHHPFIDEHIIYALVLLGLASARAGHTLGLGKWWSNTSLVKKYNLLE